MLQVARPENDGLNRLLELCNRSLAQFNQPPLYASSHDRTVAHGPRSQRVDYSACFHISLAWALVQPSVRDEERVAGIDLRAVKDLRVRFDSVKAKIGNHVENIQLPAAC